MHAGLDDDYSSSGSSVRLSTPEGSSRRFTNSDTRPRKGLIYVEEEEPPIII